MKDQYTLVKEFDDTIQIIEYSSDFYRHDGYFASIAQRNPKSSNRFSGELARR
jgi:hypothetical protein